MVTTQDEVAQGFDARRGRRWRSTLAERAAGGRWAVWLLRTLVWAVLVGAALLVVRSALAPPTAQLVDAAVERRLTDQARDWPTDEARAAAAHHVTDALARHGGGETVPTQRGSGAIEADDRVSQYVEALAPGRVEVIDHDRATVEIGVRLQTFREEGDGAQFLRHWRWLAVPVARVDGRAVATGGMTEIPPPPEVDLPAPRLPEVSTELTDETRELAEALFTAWSDESRAALDALTDGSIALLAADLELVEVARWQVAEPPSRGVNTGAPTELSAHAEVVWRQPGDVIARQLYAVRLERDAADRWRVTDLGPAHPHREER